MPGKNFNDLFIHELKDIASAEEQLVDALPRMVSAAKNPELKKAIRTHLTETESQLKRVIALLETLGEKPGGMKCAGMAGIVKEGEKVLQEGFEGPTLDAAIIGAAQRVEHYEMAAYGTARAYAEVLGNSDAVSVLEEILEEEENADEKLSEIAEGINSEANASKSAGAKRT